MGWMNARVRDKGIRAHPILDLHHFCISCLAQEGVVGTAKQVYGLFIVLEEGAVGMAKQGWVGSGGAVQAVGS